MWVRLLTLLLMTLLAAATCGCSMPMEGGYAFSLANTRAESPPPSVAAFNAAVEMVSKLQYVEGMAGFERVLPGLQDTSDHRRVAEAIFWLGFCSEKLGRPAEAISRYDSVIRRYSDSPASSRARVRLSQLRSAPSGENTTP